MKYLLATAAVLALSTPACQAANSGIPGHPFGAGECTTFNIGGTDYSFKTTDVGNNMLGRFTMVNDAMLGKYSIEVRIASETGRSVMLDTVECINADGEGVLKLTPFAIK